MARKKNITTETVEVETKTTRFDDTPVNKVKCPDCTWKSGFLDEHTYCPTCNGSGLIVAEPLE